MGTNDLDDSDTDDDDDDVNENLISDSEEEQGEDKSGRMENPEPSSESLQSREFSDNRV
jgi:hypothetical protein